MGGVEDAYDMHMGYDDATSVEAMRQILPSSINELPSSFEQIGHIAHLNLRDDLLPFKHQIGQVRCSIICCYYILYVSVLLTNWCSSELYDCVAVTLFYQHATARECLLYLF